MTALKFGLLYDFRNPADWRRPWASRYREVLDQIVSVDELGSFDSVHLSEHHFVDDGYTPSVLSLAVAVAALTQRVEIGTNILQLPLHNPLRVAEDSLTADVVSNGRFRLGVGVGYREPEFLGFGTSLSQRGSRMEESVGIVRRAFRGERYSCEGPHFPTPELTVTPRSPRDSGPEIWIAALSAAAIDRAARLGDGFLPALPEHVGPYLEALSRHGKPTHDAKIGLLQWTVVGEDPERTFARVGPHVMYQINQYMDYGFFGPPDQIARLTQPAQVVADGYYQLLDEVGAVKALSEAAEMGVSEFQFFAQFPGESIESSNERLEFLATRVLPYVGAERVP